jgi:hypothetical protein
MAADDVEYIQNSGKTEPLKKPAMQLKGFEIPLNQEGFPLI